jgi:uncharacterized protein YbaR (Trm112 family)
MGAIQQCPACKNEVTQVKLVGNILFCPHCNNALLMFDEDRGQQVRNLCVLQEKIIEAYDMRFVQTIETKACKNYWIKTINHKIDKLIKEQKDEEVINITID